MTATANLLGYVGKVNIIEETTTGYEIELLQGNLKGKKTFISKNSKNETLTIPNQKFTSKISYTVDKERNEDTQTEQVYSRNFELTITATSEEIAGNIWDNCFKYLKENSDIKLGWVGCPGTEDLENGKFSYCDCITIFDKEEYEELKYLYKEWKSLGKM